MNVSGDRMHPTEKPIIRPFITKALQIIIQGRQAKYFATECVDRVGPRNNIMLHVKEDPAVTSFLKQKLPSSYVMQVNDRLHLSTLVSRPNVAPVTLEVWEFHLAPISHEPDDSFLKKCKSRFLERQGTLLKSIMVITRLLPGYGVTKTLQREGLQSDYSLNIFSSSASNTGAVGITYLDPAPDHVQHHLCSKLGNKDYAVHTIGYVYTPSGVHQLVVRVHYCAKVNLSPVYNMRAVTHAQITLTTSGRSQQSATSHSPVTMNTSTHQLTRIASTGNVLRSPNAVETLHRVPEEGSAIFLSSPNTQPQNEAKVLSSSVLNSSSSSKSLHLKRLIQPAFVADDVLNNLDEELSDDENADDIFPFQNLLSTHCAIMGSQTLHDTTKSQLGVKPISSNSRKTLLPLSKTRPDPKRLCECVLRFPFLPQEPTILADCLSTRCDYGDVYAEVRDCHLDIFRTPLTDENPRASIPILDETSLLVDLENHESTLLEFDKFVSNFHPDTIRQQT